MEPDSRGCLTRDERSEVIAGRGAPHLGPAPRGKGGQALPMAVARSARYPIWPALRVLCLAGTFCVIGLDVVYPRVGLALFWNGLIAYLPLLFLVAPGVWRNVCPMAMLGGLPRRLGKAGTRRLSAKAQGRTPFIAVGLFFLLVPLRTLGLEHDGLAVAVFMALLLCIALVGGLLFAGKAGWCSQICPMLAVERLYGMSPLVAVRDTHCAPCVGCARNCYDLQPTTAALIDLSSKNNPTGNARLLFAGALPWFCVGFFTQPPPHLLTIVGVLGIYGRLGLLTLLGAAVGVFVARYGPWSRYQVIILHAAVAVNIYYLVVVESTLAALHIHDFGLGLLAHALVMMVTVVWARRALARETSFRGRSGAARRLAPRAA
jgi:nitrite reductase (NADH) large subunit